MLAAVLLVPGHDQLLADVAREVEVDVGKRRARGSGTARARARPRPGRHARARSGSRRSSRPSFRVHAPAEDVRATETPLTSSATSRASSSTSQCSRKNPARPSSRSARALRPAVPAHASCVHSRRCTLVEGAVADSGELRDRRLVPVREIRIAVAELLGQVEFETRGQLRRARRLRIVGKRSAIAAGGRRTLSWLPRRSRSQPSSDVLCLIATSASWSGARHAWCAWASPGDRPHAKRLGELTKRCVSPGVPPLVRTLELDEERRARHARAGPRCSDGDGETLARATGEADEPSFSSSSRLCSSAGGSGSACLRPGVGEGGRDQPAEVS